MQRFQDTAVTVLTVSELTVQIRNLLEGSFTQVTVTGEISNAKRYPSGHWYFSLKDQDATLPCVCFKGNSQRLKFDPEDGLKVVASGRLSVYPPRGGYQLMVSCLEPVGIGDWQLAFEQLRARLQSEGILDPARKRAIPLLPQRIGVVTSPAGAALRDILNTLSRRQRQINLVISPSKVQGEGSACEIAQAIGNIQKVPGVDVVIIARGGGSIEDLWSFNTEVVARAVATCKLPTISGVGHETDVTICDLVADLRAPTPTAAAELVARGHTELIESWANMTRRLISTIDYQLIEARHRLERASPLNMLARYQHRLTTTQMAVAACRQRLINQISSLVSDRKHRWQASHKKLEALGPLNVLNRGFSILRRQDGSVVRRAADVEPGEAIEALLASGRLRLIVADIEDSWF